MPTDQATASTEGPDRGAAEPSAAGPRRCAGGWADRRVPLGLIGALLALLGAALLVFGFWIGNSSGQPAPTVPPKPIATAAPEPTRPVTTGPGATAPVTTKAGPGKPGTTKADPRPTQSPAITRPKVPSAP